MQHKPASAEDMYLTHCTTGGDGFDILAALTLTPSHCAGYDEDLLYLFYGRPAFKPNANLGSSVLIEVAPVCLVLDPSVLQHSVRLLPFDSGGFDRYRPSLGPNLSLAEFEMGRDPTAPLRLISAFYETTSNYYDQKHRTNLTIPDSSRAAAGYARLIADETISHDDDRRSTIEVQLNKPVSLKNALRAIIAPSVFFEDPVVKNALSTCPDIVPINFRTYGRSQPISLCYPIYQHLYHLLESKGCFQ